MLRNSQDYVTKFSKISKQNKDDFFAFFLPKGFDSERRKAYKVTMGLLLINCLSVKFKGDKKLSVFVRNG